MSNRGVFIRAASPLSRNRMIELSVKLFESCRVEHRANLVILGQVVRADASGAAVRILRHGFARS